MSNGMNIIIHLIAGLIKKMRQYFLKPNEPFGVVISVKVDLSNFK